MSHTTASAVPPFESRPAMFLDLDGTLVDFVEHPDRLRASSDLVGILRELYRVNDGAVALVSGRTIASIDTIVSPLRLPVAGLHGLERRDATGRLHEASLEDDEGAFARGVAEARRKFDALVEKYPGSFIEEKGAMIAFHYRGAPAAAEEIRTVASELERLLPPPYCVQRGKMVLEICSCVHSKGSAIASFMKDPPFFGRKAVFIGDDVTDEDGFAWVNDNDGVSIKVGPGGSSARYRFDDVSQVLAWLGDYVRYLNAGGREASRAP